MAKRKRSTASAPRTTIVRVPARQSAPIIKVSAPRAAPKKRKRSRRRNGVGGGSSLMPSSGMMGVGLGGAIYGFAVKQGWVAKLPAIPIIGRTGTAAILLDYYAKHGGGSWARNAATAAAALAGYQLGSEGAIMGGGQHFATAGYDGYYTGDAGTPYYDDDGEYTEGDDGDDDDDDDDDGDDDGEENDFISTPG